MAEIRKVLLFIGIIYSRENKSNLNKIKDTLIEKFGNIILDMQAVSFDYTSYYNLEMGNNLEKIFYAFEHFINSLDISKIKIFTNEIEQRFAAIDKKRKFNLDPGYLDLAKIVLVSTKDFAHRIYIGDEIFAELTMLYNNPKKSKEISRYKFLPWTYPDFKTENYLEFFIRARNFYLDEMRREKKLKNLIN
ncbi:MAG: DUF4416 family protein [Elusimicrobiota bacterium]|jgi:hypothetical protein|nr:DUF4416 family protein [Elusimicrobiota bacterium]